jgi:O-antigen/teichoic acid export membrane protein
MSESARAPEPLASDVVKRRAIHGVFFAILGNLPVQVLSASTSIYAGRVLGPAAYGAFSLAATIYGVSNLVTNSGLTTFIVRNPECSDHTIDVAWTVAVLRGLLVTLLLWVIAFSAMSWFGAGVEATRLLQVLALGQALDGFTNFHAQRFAHQLRFGTTVILDSLGGITGSVCALILLRLWRTPMAFAAGVTIGRGVGMLASWAVARRRPRPRLDLREIQKMWRFSRVMTLNSLIVYVQFSSDNLLVARIAGTAALGAYALAFRLANAATLFLITPLWRVFLPVFARLQNEPGQFTKSVERSLSASAAAAWCLSATAFTFAPELFLTISPNGKWNAAVYPFRALVGFTVARAINQPLSQMVLAKNKPGLLTLVSGVQLGLLLPSVWFGYHTAGLGGVGLAVSVLAFGSSMALILAAPRFILTTRLRLLAFVLAPGVAACLAAFIGAAVASPIALPFLRALVGGAISGALFLAQWELFCRARAVRRFGYVSVLSVLGGALRGRAQAAV